MIKKFFTLILLLPLTILSAAEAGYSFPAMGDFHYDRMAMHDKAFIKKRYPRDMSQITNYIKASEKYAPKLVAAVSEQITPETPFVIQLGDFTEGLCGSREYQEAMFKGAIDQVKEKIKVPFLVTKGNHDITGPGSKDAYVNVILPFLSKELNQPIGRADFVVKHGQDAFVFFDSMVRDLDWLEKALAENAGARYLFVATHYPIIPYEYRSDWCLFAKPGQEKQRTRLIKLLKKANAIVLSGHMHQASYIDYREPDGGFVQLSHNSVMRSDNPKIRNVKEGAKAYTPALAEHRRAKSDKLEYRKKLFAASAPFVKDFFCADAEGYILMKVSPKEIKAEFFSGANKTPDKIIRVR